MTVKEKLKEYRRKKYKEEITESIKVTIGNVLPWNRNCETEKLVEESTKQEEKVQLCEKPQDIQENDQDTWLENNVQKSKSTVITTVIYILYFMLWVILYVIAIEYEFGAVYFILSTLIFIWLNTRSEPKQQGEPSAYSVFNPNCEAIEGTLDASQFEREIRYGIGSTQ
ncbi:uncharacterized protein LOC116846768 isoform X1 [Odontomachus brunneus]|uniref:uncharacterized protein LOC116846768 isoform X1 n=1 Tax=Odontomachus brunneus TaxID=486640 RepID=UPI0013F1DF01|nr:uncharacterized protein LOC116846768 isoform X1 [Odontomachus brunneus]XP_032676922.1 uncharacterized protein LOC116846768 isoform X1 [Odontomachus brunneus]